MLSPPLIEKNTLQGKPFGGDMKYSIHIVDDESSGRTTLKILLEKEFWSHTKSLTFSKTFDEAKEKLRTTQFDIVFLDVNLKGISAFDLMTFIPLATKVIFVTAYSEFMLKALRNKAFDYLVKPIKEEELKECLLRIQREFFSNSDSQILHIKQRGLTRMLRLSDIIYLQGNGPYSTIYLRDESCTTARTLKSILPELGHGFIRIHKTYVVNRTQIKGFNKDKLILLTDQSLPVSRTGLKNLSL